MVAAGKVCSAWAWQCLFNVGPDHQQLFEIIVPSYVWFLVKSSIASHDFDARLWHRRIHASISFSDLTKLSPQFACTSSMYIWTYRLKTFRLNNIVSTAIKAGLPPECKWRSARAALYARLLGLWSADDLYVRESWYLNTHCTINVTISDCELVTGNQASTWDVCGLRTLIRRWSTDYTPYTKLSYR